MKKILLLCSILMLSSCSTSKSGTSKSLDVIGAGVIHRPVIADLDVQQEQVSATITFSGKSTLSNTRNEAIRKALTQSDANVLVEPSFESVTKNGRTELTVTGWPATYKNFRQMEEEDIKYLEIQPHYLQKAEMRETAVEEKKSNSGLWITIGALLIGAVVAAVTL